MFYKFDVVFVGDLLSIYEIISLVFIQSKNINALYICACELSSISPLNSSKSQFPTIYKDFPLTLYPVHQTAYYLYLVKHHDCSGIT